MSVRKSNILAMGKNGLHTVDTPQDILRLWTCMNCTHPAFLARTWTSILPCRFNLWRQQYFCKIKSWICILATKSLIWLGQTLEKTHSINQCFSTIYNMIIWYLGVECTRPDTSLSSDAETENPKVLCSIFDSPWTFCL